MPHLSLQISPSPETCALPCRIWHLRQQMFKNGFPHEGWSSCWVSANSAVSKELCLQTTHPSARDGEPWTLGDPQHHPTACDAFKWQLLLLVLHCLSTVPPTHEVVSTITCGARARTTSTLALSECGLQKLPQPMPL